MISKELIIHNLSNSFVAILHIRDSKTGIDSNSGSYYLMLNQGSNSYVVNGVSGSVFGKMEIPYNNTYYDGLTLYATIGNNSETSRLINISWNESDLK